MKSSLSQNHLAIVRLIARQAVRDHLQGNQPVPCRVQPERSKRPVQIPPATK